VGDLTFKDSDGIVVEFPDPVRAAMTER